ncbi:MAG TPA: peptidylprolyl isomerase [Xanthobacteraceae bacterium]|nr:peptidylprolyl isomerase [Xanthobacteraceae bacterium]
MTSTSLPVRTDRFRLPYRRAGLLAAIVLQVLVSGCWPGSDDTASKDNKMAPVAGTTAAASKAMASGTPAPAGSSAAVTPQSEGPVVAKVNGVEIREGDIKLAEEDIGQQMTQVPPESKRDYLVTYVGDMILLTQAAEAKKIGDSDEFKQQLEFTRKKLLMAKLLDSEAKAASTESAMRKIYDDATKQMKPEEEVHARHILVETEEEAKAVQEELRKGADFAETAKSKSKDPGAAAEGGDLGFFSKDQMVPEFADAAFKLEKGQLSEPVKSPFGWHVILVEDKRTRPLPDFEQVKPQLETFVARKAQSEYLAKLREGAKIERLDKPADAPAAAPATPAPAEQKK